MTCQTALDRMLEAEPAELRGVGHGGLAAHIAGCDRCRRVAAAILDGMDAADRSLADFAAVGDADAAAGAALAAIRAAGDAGRHRDLLPRRLTWARRAWVPLAAAAALAAVLVLGRGDRPVANGPPPAAAPPIAPRVSVTPPADRGAAIMETANPNITIVWLYEREGT